MTVDTYSAGDYSGLASGVDDFDPTDLKLPRIKILHSEGKFLNPATEEEMDSLSCVVLCFAKQRVMFDPVFDDSKPDQSPWCKSNDHETGFPGKEFPWDQSNRTQNDLTLTDLGNYGMPCEGCSFSKWGPKNHKTGKSAPPPCNELHTYAILYYNQGTGEYVPAVISFKSSSIKASSSYMQNFVTSRRPIFTVFTQIDLTTHRRGSVAYSVARFSVTGDTPQELWADYSSQSLSVRSMLRAEPVIIEDEDDDEGGAQAQAPAQPVRQQPRAQQAPAQAAPQPQPQAQAQPQVIQGQVVNSTQAPVPETHTHAPAPQASPSHPAQGRTRPAPPTPPAPKARPAQPTEQPQAQTQAQTQAPAPQAHGSEDDDMPF